MRQRILIAGGGGFIGGYLAKKLLDNGHDVLVADIKPFSEWHQFHDHADNRVLNLEEKGACKEAAEACDTIYNFACNMGGMGFIENNRALCMLSVLINTHLLMAAKEHCVKQYLYASSACVYAADKQTSDAAQPLKEEFAYPAMPEDGYGWEKLFSERMCHHFAEDYGLDLRVARFHNVYGPFGTWDGGREKAPAAICRKVIEAVDKGNFEVEIWGDGEQSRSFMYIDDCITGICKLTHADYRKPINIGRDELVTINHLVDIVEEIAGVKVKRNYKLNAPQGVRGRNSDNELIREVLNWEPGIELRDGMEKTFHWIKQKYEYSKKQGNPVLIDGI
jgi:GDP-D-mannose 3',5'-epimerase